MSRVLVAAAVVAAATVVALPSTAARKVSPPLVNAYRYASFDAGWQGVGNRSVTPPCHPAVFDFGWQPGRVGGTLARSTAYRAYYATPVADKTYASSLSASGAITLPTKTGAGASFGWFNAVESTDWRTPDSLVLRASGDTLGWNLYSDTASVNALAVGGGAMPAGARFLYNHRYLWTITYTPPVAAITVTDPDTLQVWPSSFVVPAQLLADGATFDRFGIQSQQVEYGGTPISFFLDSLVVDGASVDLATDPGWDALSNRASFVDCVVHGREDFGDSPTGLASGHAGEVGGTVWRGSKAWFGDTTASTLTGADALYATGTIRLTQATSDTDVYVGWFNDTTTWQGSPLVVSRDAVYGAVGGPSRVGFRFTPALYSSTGGSAKYGFDSPAQYAQPLFHAGGRSRHFSVCYHPNADGSATLTTTLDADLTHGIPAATSTVPVPAAVVTGGLAVNRFGVFTGANGGHSVGLYLDDLRYTIEPGDAC